MALCFVEGLGARGGVIVGVGLSRALQYGGGIRISLALGVAHSLGRRLVMKLRVDGLRSGWAAFCAGRCVPDLSLKLLDLRCAWPAMGSATTAKQSGGGRRDEEAD
jgi:hypothetical protein